MKTRNFTYLAIAAMLANALDASAFDFVLDGIYYNITGYYTVEVTSKTPYTGCYSGWVSIPNCVTYQDMTYEVTRIGDSAFSYCRDLTDVSIPPSVQEIGTCAFNFCCNLTSVTIPESVTYIENMAFTCCTSLTNVSSHAIVPPRILCTTFDSSFFSNATLVVPWGTLEDYQRANYWENVKDIQEMPRERVHGARHCK